MLSAGVDKQTGWSLQLLWCPFLPSLRVIIMEHEVNPETQNQEVERDRLQKMLFEHLDLTIPEALMSAPGLFNYRSQ